MAKGYLEVRKHTRRVAKAFFGIVCSLVLYPGSRPRMHSGVQIWLLCRYPNIHDGSVCHEPGQTRSYHKEREPACLAVPGRLI